MELLSLPVSPSCSMYEFCLQSSYLVVGSATSNSSIIRYSIIYSIIYNIVLYIYNIIVLDIVLLIVALLALF